MSLISQKSLSMDNKHFDQLVKAVRQMNRHMSGQVVPGAKTTKSFGARCARDPRSRKDQPVSIRQAHWRESAHTAELGAAPYAALRSGTCAAKDCCIGPKVGNRGAECLIAPSAVLATYRVRLGFHDPGFPFTVYRSPFTAVTVHHLPFAVHWRVDR